MRDYTPMVGPIDPDPSFRIPMQQGAEPIPPYPQAGSPARGAGHQFQRGPADSAARKHTPLFSGAINYFPDALMDVARLSHAGNEKHNPGEPLHWARGKSVDHEDCIARHLVDSRAYTTEAGERFLHATCMAWRALAHLQTLIEDLRSKGEYS